MRLIPRAAVLFVGFLALTGMSSCQSADAERERTAPPTDEPRPALNPKPQHLVRVYGRLPKHMTLRMVTSYATTTNDPACQRYFSLGSFGGGMPLGFSERFPEIRHSGDRFEATLVVDKHLPGKCGWRYESSNVIVVKLDRPDETDSLISALDGERYGVDDSVPRCTHRHRNCTEERLWRLGNHDERIPVLARCRMNPIDEPSQHGGRQAHLMCGDLFNESYKKWHLIMPETRQVRIDVYDLDVDPDPAPLPRKESKP